MNIYVVLAPFACLSKHVTLVPFACLSKGLKSRLYEYLRGSRPFCFSLQKLGEQILCIFTWFSTPLLASQNT